MAYKVKIHNGCEWDPSCHRAPIYEVFTRANRRVGKFCVFHAVHKVVRLNNIEATEDEVGR